MGKGMYGAIDEEEVVAAIDQAIDLGITLFDTAPIYGWGYGEELLGQALKGKRDKVVLVTKGGRKWNAEKKMGESDSSRDYLIECLEGSLRRLQTDYIDLYLIHWPDENTPFEVPMRALEEFRQQGKIRYGGVSNFSVSQMEECLTYFPIVCNQVGYHLFDRRCEAEIFPFCQERGLGVMAYGSLAHGLLTGTMTPETKFAEDDWRRRGTAFGQPLFQGEHFLRNLAIVDRLKKTAAAGSRAVAQLALAWLLSNPAITVALVGTRKPSELEENVAATKWKLTEDEKAEIRAAFD